MYCTKCGAKLRDGAKFCHSCGQPVRAATPIHTIPEADVRPSEVSKDKSTLKPEIKEKAIDMAKTGVKQVLAALKDSDVTAPAAAGEISCKSDPAQNAFLKLLKKGLLCLAPLLMLSIGTNAQTVFYGLTDTDNYKTDTEKGITMTVSGIDVYDCHIKDGKVKSLVGDTWPGATVTVHGVYDPRYYKKESIQRPWGVSVTVYRQVLDFKITAWAESTTYDLKKQVILEKTYTSEEGSIAFDASVPVDGYLGRCIDGVPISRITITAEAHTEKIVDNGNPHWVSECKHVSYAFMPKDGNNTSGVSASTETYDTDGIDGIESIDTEANDESGENGWIIPAAVAGGLAVGGLALKRRKKAKAAGKASKENPSGKASKEKSSGKDEKKEDDDEDDEEQASYEMRIRKDFGDTLTPGEAAQKVFARIVRIPAKGQPSTDQALTGRISISGDSYLKVSGQRMEGEYMAASVEAPQTGDIPSEAVVNFRLAGGGSSFTNRMHFKVAKSGIIFFQENITLPACSDEVWRLPFAVTGAAKDTVVEAYRIDAYDVKIEPGDKDGLYYAVIKETAKDKKEPGTYEYYNLGIKVLSGNAEMSDSIPLYRFHMGLKFKPHSTVPCYLKDGKVEKAMAELVYFDWDPETNDIVTCFPVPSDFRITAKGETEQGYLDKLGITCKVTSVTTDNGRQLEIYPVKGILDAPTRFDATITLTADCGKGRVETVSKEVLVASQPVRQNVTAADIEADRRIGEGLLNIQKSIWNNGEYNRLFPLYKLIDAMVDGYDGAYGYDKKQVETVKDVYKRFLNGDLVGANATARCVTLADEMAMFIDSFLKTSEEVENSMGFFTRMAVGVATLGMSDAVFTGLQVARDMKVTAEKGGDTWDVFVAGVKVVAVDYAMEKITDYGIGKLKSTAKKYAPKQYEAVAKGAEEARQKATDFFSGATGKKTGKVLENSKGAKSKAAAQADDAIDTFRKNPEMSDLDKKLDQVYKNGQTHGKAKVDDLQAAQWLMENNPTAENVKLYKKKVLEVQRDKFAMQQLNSLPDGNSTRAAFNGELDNVYKDVDAEVREILRKKGYDMADSPFAATSSNKPDLATGKKVTYDRDVTYKTVDGKDVPQDVAQEAYEKAFYKRTTGIDAPNDKVAGEWAQMHDQSVVQHGSPVSYEDDLNPVIKDWDQKLTNAEHTGKVMTYKSTEWFEQTNEMIRKANTLEDSGLRLDMLEQALSKRQEAARQMVKQFKYVHERDVAAQTAGALSKISERMRFGMEISSRLFSTGSDALTLGQVEAILARNNMTLELLSSQLGDTLKAIG